MFDEQSEGEQLLAAMTAANKRSMKQAQWVGPLIAVMVGKPEEAVHIAVEAAEGRKKAAQYAAQTFEHTKRDIATTVIRLPTPTPKAAADRLRLVFAGAGKLVGTESRDDGSFAVRTIVGVGLGNQHPAVVTAVVPPVSDGGVRVALRAAARDGQIKQHPAEKALSKITRLLRGATFVLDRPKGIQP